jgi:hypothetical protein
MQSIRQGRDEARQCLGCSAFARAQHGGRSIPGCTPLLRD